MGAALRILGAVLFLAAAPAAAQTGPERVGPDAAAVAQGRLIAERWCANCHTVEGRPGAVDFAPPFAVIARTRAGDPEWVRGWLSTAHPRMPDFALARAEIDAVIAYLQSIAAAETPR